ncbi:MAG: 2-succinyl-5-enolpyruvyl-6-hydroxy-3-cyclohexene-1-carboxylic-acid synthase [Planctomycetota bacterium]|nr:MAG: 2-succinyl-5-enolpyruvyl-6-hydroxy-3-cyclohexene-1-carboxylic-acid synthase [Planctomycetota bacterium]
MATAAASAGWQPHQLSILTAMSVPLQQAWATAIIAQLYAAGCRRAIICPGNRNVPLISAMLAHGQWQLRSHLDERSGAFRALGWARATDTPVAIVTTSGSALANTLPAVCEAAACAGALLIISCDRPENEHDCGAPQTMPQAGILQPFCQHQMALPDPPAQQDLWPGLLARISDIAHSCHSSPGPAHINVPLHNPQPWQENPDAGKCPAMLIEDQPRGTDPVPPSLDLGPIAKAQRGVVVVGSDSPVDTRTLTAWAAAGWPIISDCLGTSRSAPLPTLIHQADLLLAAQPHAWDVDTIIRCGCAPLARPVWEWLQRQHQATVLRFDQRPIARDFCHTSFHYAGAGKAAAMLHLPPMDRQWHHSWLAAQERCSAIVDEYLDGWHELSAAALACRIHRPQHLFVANSLSVRHANIFCSPQAPWQGIWGQRGVNGIDGNLGHACGLSEALGPTRMLIGDCAFIHDSPALAAIAEASPALQIVVLDNRGGRIFDQLPAAQDPHLIPWIRSPQPGNIADVARAFTIPATAVSDRRTYIQALAQPLTGPQVIHVQIPDGPHDHLQSLHHRLRTTMETTT